MAVIGLLQYVRRGYAQEHCLKVNAPYRYSAMCHRARTKLGAQHEHARSRAQERRIPRAYVAGARVCMHVGPSTLQYWYGGSTILLVRRVA